jgi:clan AA aspartic protease (TIGR02281 family)
MKRCIERGLVSMVSALAVLTLAGFAATPARAMDGGYYAPPEATMAATEAAQFFSNLLRTTQNPLIASVARDSLSRLGGHGNSGKTMMAVSEPSQAAVASRYEINLLPQGDFTYAVPAIINKQLMATLLVDTGASYTVITPQTAAALGIDVKSAEASGSVSITTANGTIQAPVVMLRDVKLGGMRVQNVEAVVADLGDAPQLSGLLGMSFFKGMAISFQQDKLILSR